MSKSDLAAKTCTLARAVEIVGDGWTLMILREMFLGIRRFDDFQRQTGASPALISGRLRKMEDAGLIRREAYSEHPPRYEYRLTDMGKALWPAIIALKTWGDDWVDGSVDVPRAWPGRGDGRKLGDTGRDHPQILRQCNRPANDLPRLRRGNDSA